VSSAIERRGVPWRAAPIGRATQRVIAAIRIDPDDDEYDVRIMRTGELDRRSVARADTAAQCVNEYLCSVLRR
jgi:hypothetical protein